MVRDKRTHIIEELRDVFENRPHVRAGALSYLSEVYKVVRRHRSWIRSEIDLELERNPRTSGLFADLIEVTSDCDPKTRWKYAKVLNIADENHIRFRDFQTFVKSKGGFNGVIAKFSIKRPKHAPRWT
jgi:hypothetical protein